MENNQDEGVMLESCKFQFSQEPNCLTDQESIEEIEIEFNSSLGIDRDEGGFFVLKTEQWSINGVDDLQKLFDRIQKIMQNGKQ